jgi:hypothetical protein
VFRGKCACGCLGSQAPLQKCVIIQSFSLHHKHHHIQNLTIGPSIPFFHRCPALNMPDIRSSTAAVLVPVRNVVSSSWLYPFKGIWYFCAHREFWPLWGRRLVPLTVTSIVILVLLFTFTYLPQVAFLALFHGPGAWVNAVFLVLGEGQVAIALLFEAMLVDETLVNVFDVRSTMPLMFLYPTTPPP